MKEYNKEELISKYKEYLMPSVHTSFSEPLCLERGEGEFLYDVDGNKYLDFYTGIMVVISGHCNEKVTKAVSDQIQKLQHSTSFFINRPVVELAEKLAEITPGKLKQSFFVNSGSEAVEGAINLAQIYTKNNTVIGLQHGYHGRTLLTKTLTAISAWRQGATNISDIRYTPSAYCYRCPFNATPENCDVVCANYLNEVIQTQTSGEIACVVAETIQGVGGLITPPKDYFKILTEITKRYGGLLIIDEVQTGFGRTGGKMFAIEHYGVEPDIMTMAKGLANGFAIGAFISEQEIASCFAGPSVSTFGGNPVSAAAAVANIEYIEENDILTNSERMGSILKEKLLQLKEKYSIIGDVRGRGLYWGLELVKDKKTKEPAWEEAERMTQLCKDEGLIIGQSGSWFHVLRLGPPLNITEDRIGEGIEMLDLAFSRLK
ncbi:MAG: aspartate aminotransferase family protein [Desulfobacterales bacterium]|nr:aspartate aminotransferase family protein [Desulfobacterales bacterium]